MIEGSKHMASMDLNELSELYFASDKGSRDHDIVNDPPRLLQDMGQQKFKTKSIDGWLTNINQCQCQFDDDYTEYSIL